MPVPSSAPAGCRWGLPDPPQPGTVCPDGSAPRDREADRELRNILGLDESDEDHPLESYDIGCDEGSWNAFLRKLWCGAQAMPFSWGKWTVGIGIDFMGWALEFRIADSLTPVAGLLSRIYDTSLIGPLGVRHLAWSVAMFVGGWQLLRARFARGASEIASTFMIATIGAIVLANPQGYLEGSVTLAKNTSGAVLEAIDDTLSGGSSAHGADAVRQRLGHVLRHSFVAEPYDLVNWGEPLTGQCAAARDEILAGGPWGSEDRPREIMREHGCGRQADFNEKPTDSRAAASLIVALAAIAATVLLVVMALVVFVAQLTMVALFAGASIVWTLALFPGAREMLWWWLGRLVWAVTATIGATFVLSWLAVTVTAALAASSDISIIQRCLVALLVVAFGFRLRSQVGRAVESASRRLGDRVGQVATRQQSRWPGLAAAAGAGGAGGFGLAATARSWALDAPGGQYAYNRLYARHFTRGYRNRGGVLRTAQGAIGHANRAGEAVAGTGVRATQAVVRGAGLVAAAPVLGPAFGAARSGATAASSRARDRLRQARAVRATGDAHARLRQAREIHRQRAREAGHPVQAQLDAHREARETARQARRAGRSPGAVPARPDPETYDWM